MKRINEYVETAKSLKERQEAMSNREAQSIREAEENRNNFIKKYHSIRENREARERMHGVLMEEARNNALSTAIKGIYIGALEAGTLTDNGIFLAETMVDNWIKERGGASKILSEISNNTYFLARLTQIVEDAAKEEVDKIEKDVDEEDVDEKKEDSKSEDKDDSKKEKDDKSEDKKDEDSKSEDDSKEDKDKEEEDKSEDDTKDDDSDKEEDPSDDPLNYTGDDDEDEEESDDDTEEDDNSVVIVDNDEDEEESLEDDDENKDKVFEDLDKEEDVQKAVELIRKRVADAEETFIKNNAEDKKKIDDLLGKISDNVKTVEDMGDENSTESKIAKESATMNNRKIKDITENRPLTVFEKMTRELGSSIVRNVSVREQYLDENGSLDSGSVVESARVMYGFLETLNTLKLEKVDEKYIAKVLEEIR